MIYHSLVIQIYIIKIIKTHKWIKSFKFIKKNIIIKYFYKNKDCLSIQDFDFIKLLAKGAYGRVWLVRRKVTGDIYAMKIINMA